MLLSFWKFFPLTDDGLILLLSRRPFFHILQQIFSPENDVPQPIYIFFVQLFQDCFNFFKLI